MRKDTTQSLKKHVWEIIFHAFEGVWEHLGRSLKKGSKKVPFLIASQAMLVTFFGEVAEHEA